jgi:hypothetical protein
MKEKVALIVRCLGIYIYRNNQNIIVVVAVPPNSNDNFLSRQSNSAHVYYVKIKRLLSPFQPF